MQHWCDHLPETPSFLQQLLFINIHVVSCELRSFLGSNQHFHPPFSVASGFTAQPLECPHPAPTVFGSRSIPVTCSGKQTLQHWAYPQYSLQYWAPLHQVVCDLLWTHELSTVLPGRPVLSYHSLLSSDATNCWYLYSRMNKKPGYGYYQVYSLKKNRLLSIFASQDASKMQCSACLWYLISYL